MLIGIDASRAQIREKTGTENYSENLIKNLSSIDKKNHYRLYLRNSHIPFDGPNVEKKVIPWSRFWTQGGLALEVLKNPPDILFIPAHTLPVIRPRNLKTVVTIHDLGAEFLPGYHRAWQREYLLFSTKYAVKSATALIAVSQATKNDLVKKLNANQNKIFVVYEGVDLQKFKSQSANWRTKIKNEKTLRKYGLKNDFFLFVGTIQPRKNLVRLIEAFSLLGRQDLSLVLVGKKGWLSDEIHEAPKRFGVESKVKFLGYVPIDDLVILYSNCRAFILPSLVEGFGLPALEAMACGARVVLSNTSSLPEVGGDAAIYVDPYDVKSIAGGLRKSLTTDGEFKKKPVERAKLFSWDKCARETLQVLEKVHLGDI